MMKFTLAWLKEHLDTDRALGEITDKLTMIGLEVERVEDMGKQLAPFTIARVVEAKQHPNADRLRVCMVDTGTGDPVQVVCGAPNARTGMKGVFVPPGAYIPGKDMTLAIGTIRGVESRGMLVSEFELKISDDHEGIIDLPDDAPVGASYAHYAGLDDPVIEINLTPNRPDCAGVHGIARDLAAADIGKFKDTAIKPVKGEFPCPVAVQIEAPELCPAFALRLVRGVKNGPSPAWLQKRLTAIGLRPINALVDITNFITYDRGRPLHVFDAAKVRGNLTVRRAQNGEKAAGARRQDLHARRQRLRHCRRGRRRIARRHHGRRNNRLLGHHHRRADRIGAVERDQYRAERPQARHQFRRPLPFRARRRSGLHAAGARIGDAHGAGSVRRHAVGGRPSPAAPSRASASSISRCSSSSASPASPCRSRRCAACWNVSASSSPAKASG